MNKSGPRWTNKGQSSEAKANEAAQTAFYNQMTSEQSTAFSENQQLESTIKGIWEPVFEKGPTQYGFTPQEDQALKSEIMQTGAEANEQAENATELAEKQAGGGKTALPTGAEEATKAAQEVLGNQSTATNLENETLQGYQQGYQEFLNASNALTGQQQINNPNATAEATVGAGSDATKAIQQADSERTNILGTILGGIASNVSLAGKTAGGMAWGI